MICTTLTAFTMGYLPKLCRIPHVFRYDESKPSKLYEREVAAGMMSRKLLDDVGLTAGANGRLTSYVSEFRRLTQNKQKEICSSVLNCSSASKQSMKC